MSVWNARIWHHCRVEFGREQEEQAKIMEQTVVNGSVHTACKQHQRVRENLHACASCVNGLNGSGVGVRCGSVSVPLEAVWALSHRVQNAKKVVVSLGYSTCCLWSLICLIMPYFVSLTPHPLWPKILNPWSLLTMEPLLISLCESWWPWTKKNRTQYRYLGTASSEKLIPRKFFWIN